MNMLQTIHTAQNQIDDNTRSIESIIYNAIDDNNIENLRELCDYEIINRDDYGLLNSIALRGNLEAFKLLHEYGCICEETAYIWAFEEGHDCITDYISENVVMVDIDIQQLNRMEYSMST